MRAAPMEEFDEPRGFWNRIKDRIGLGQYEEEDEIEFIEDSEGHRKPTMLRVHPSRINRVSVWLSVQSFENAQQAADGLKAGHQQIVNLEKAAPEVCTRVIDFLNGVIYALDGYVEKVGEKVYLFTPANYVIEVENGTANRRIQGPFYEN